MKKIIFALGILATLLCVGFGKNIAEDPESKIRTVHNQTPEESIKHTPNQLLQNLLKEKRENIYRNNPNPTENILDHINKFKDSIDDFEKEMAVAEKSYEDMVNSLIKSLIPEKRADSKTPKPFGALVDTTSNEFIEDPSGFSDEVDNEMSSEDVPATINVTIDSSRRSKFWGVVLDFVTNDYMKDFVNPTCLMFTTILVNACMGNSSVEPSVAASTEYETACLIQGAKDYFECSYGREILDLINLNNQMLVQESYKDDSSSNFDESDYSSENDDYPLIPTFLDDRNPHQVDENYPDDYPNIDYYYEYLSHKEQSLRYKSQFCGQYTSDIMNSCINNCYRVTPVNEVGFYPYKLFVAMSIGYEYDMRDDVDWNNLPNVPVPVDCMIYAIKNYLSCYADQPFEQYRVKATIEYGEDKDNVNTYVEEIDGDDIDSVRWHVRRIANTFVNKVINEIQNERYNLQNDDDYSYAQNEEYEYVSDEDSEHGDRQKVYDSLKSPPDTRNVTKVYSNSSSSSAFEYLIEESIICINGECKTIRIISKKRLSDYTQNLDDGFDSRNENRLGHDSNRDQSSLWDDNNYDQISSGDDSNYDQISTGDDSNSNQNSAQDDSYSEQSASE